MKNLIVYYDQDTLQTKLQDVPIPSPDPDEILIKVHFAGSNPKDFKHPLPKLYNNALNQGDDCAGTIAAFGSAVKSFQIGERVAGFHKMDTPNGTYAEYALCPEHTVFRIPDTMSFEEAATIPLTAFTAAVGLYRNLGLPAPWNRSDEHVPGGKKVPLVINGASGAVGAFAVKLAKMNPRIGPIIATAGSSKSFVESLDPDAIVDYRSATIAEDIKKALGSAELRHVFDTNNTIQSVKYLTAAMAADGRYSCTSELNDGQEEVLKAAGVWYEITFVGDVHGQPFPVGPPVVKRGGELFGRVMSQMFEQALLDETLTGHPYEEIKGGLDGVLGALNELQHRKGGGNAKFVVRVAEASA